jgi:glycosyltransferase involved in cell wall biosynthesis
MKIAIVIGSLERGGSEKQIVAFVRAAHPTYADCVVVCLGDEGELAEHVRESGAKVISLRMSRFRLSGLIDLAWTLRKEKPDAVYAFLFWGYTLALPLAAVVARRAVRIAARRSLPEHDVPGRLVLRDLSRIADRVSHAVIANSEAVARSWERERPRLRGRIHVVENCIELGEARSHELRDPVRIACVANLKSYKGHSTLIDALTLLSRERNDWEVCLVGEGPERRRIEDTLWRRGLTDKVELCGRRADVDDLLAEADIVVLPSYTEGSPNALLEAMAHGLPVVATDVGGVRDLVGSDAGLVVPPRDPVRLAAALRQMIARADLRRSAGAAGRQIVTTRYTTGAMRARTLALMDAMRRSIASKPRKSRQLTA